jgi:SPP1 family predicted phage head-tail adaptor
MAVQAGKYRHLVRLQKQVFTPDNQGGYTNAWTEIDEVHAEVIQGGGTEILHAGQLETVGTYQVKMRWRKDFTPAQRLIWEDGDESRILDVTSASSDGKRRELTLGCIERTPGPGPVGS